MSPAFRGRPATGAATPAGVSRPLAIRDDRRLVRQGRRLPESVEPSDVTAFLDDLETHRDRAITLAMVLGGLRAAEVRSLRLADVDMGMRRLRVVGKGGRERVVPVDQSFFDECACGVKELDRRPDLAVSRRGDLCSDFL